MSRHGGRYGRRSPRYSHGRRRWNSDLSECGHLNRLFDLAAAFPRRRIRRRPPSKPLPKTASSDRLRILLERGVERVSLGVQSFLDAETHAIGRPQSSMKCGPRWNGSVFPVLNIDLIYGHPTQTVASWLFLRSEAVLELPAGRVISLSSRSSGHGPGSPRRHFSLPRIPFATPLPRSTRLPVRGRLCAELHAVFSESRRVGGCASAPVYCCQTDDMLGLGCGALVHVAVALFEPICRGGSRRSGDLR